MDSLERKILKERPHRVFSTDCLDSSGKMINKFALFFDIGERFCGVLATTVHRLSELDVRETLESLGHAFQQYTKMIIAIDIV